jgi:hypothetical protein
LHERFLPRVETGRASLEPGLFYRFQVGANLEDFERAHTRSWAAVGHFLALEAERDRILVHPVRDAHADGTLELLERVSPNGTRVVGPIEVT